MSGRLVDFVEHAFGRVYVHIKVDTPSGIPLGVHGATIAALAQNVVVVRGD